MKLYALVRDTTGTVGRLALTPVKVEPGYRQAVLVLTDERLGNLGDGLIVEGAVEAHVTSYGRDEYARGQIMPPGTIMLNCGMLAISLSNPEGAPVEFGKKAIQSLMQSYTPGNETAFFARLHDEFRELLRTNAEQLRQARCTELAEHRARVATLASQVCLLDGVKSSLLAPAAA